MKINPVLEAKSSKITWRNNIFNKLATYQKQSNGIVFLWNPYNKRKKKPQRLRVSQRTQSVKKKKKKSHERGLLPSVKTKSYKINRKQTEQLLRRSKKIIRIFICRCRILSAKLIDGIQSNEPKLEYIIILKGNPNLNMQNIQNDSSIGCNHTVTNGPLDPGDKTKLHVFRFTGKLVAPQYFGFKQVNKMMIFKEPVVVITLHHLSNQTIV